MSQGDGGNSTSAGWYDDGHGVMRWWNGSSWTEHVQPPAPAPGDVLAPSSTGVREGKPWYARRAVWAAGAAAVVVIAIASASAGGGDEPNNEKPTAAGESSEPQSDDSANLEEVTEDDAEPADTDADGVTDDVDLEPENPKVQTEDDIDTDKDKVPDFKDDFPKDPEYSKDTDGDRVADQLDDFPKDADYSKDSDGDEVADSEDAYPSDPSQWKITLAMENALDSAQDYLDFSAFSRQGLIDQLASEYGAGFRLEEATWAVSQLDVDWRQQAVRSAKDYLDFSSFSRQGLIDQLASPYGAQFTVEEATYAVNKIGL